MSEQSGLTQRLTASGALFGAAFLWGSPIPIVGEMMERWDVFYLGIIRYGLALPLMLVIAAASLGWRWPPLRPEGISYFRLFLLGGVGIASFAILYILALAYMDPAMAAVVAAMAPITSGVVALCFGERPSRGLLIAVALSVLGGGVAAWDFDAIGSPISFRGGEFIFLLAQVVWAWYSLACRRYLPNSTATVVTYATIVPGAITLCLLTLVIGAFGGLKPWPTTIPLADYGYIALLGFGGVALAILFWNVGVAGLGLTASALHMNLIPVVAISIAFLLGVEPRWEQLLGGTIVLAGVLQAQLSALRWRRILVN
ncbi:MAG: DMT family transporter [Pseudomonadota bacterium]